MEQRIASTYGWPHIVDHTVHEIDIKLIRTDKAHNSRSIQVRALHLSTFNPIEIASHRIDPQLPSVRSQDVLHVTAIQC